MPKLKVRPTLISFRVKLLSVIHGEKDCVLPLRKAGLRFTFDPVTVVLVCSLVFMSQFSGFVFMVSVFTVNYFLVIAFNSLL